MLQVEHATYAARTFLCNVRSLSRNPYMECAGKASPAVQRSSAAINIMSYLKLHCDNNCLCRPFSAFHS